ncbi:thymidylate synthase (FAD) [Hydrogenivirga caldilitoris]|uniref:FAD-dependent thymidylate synthase n=1 Tax=Hydrogenivirga caldilitoris TaxID=246264 RepID=A0A497XRG3_9AQUI|nr:FAD-dependent thymidylate synthase [Hydrogenivirga caldilitoris]RLJ71546.1 thymidylate synthase (FAD) [Hydrogenivirga caldilitoris]
MEVFLMGSDQRSVRCARVSFGKDEKTDPERDKKLIRFLFKHRHASPFEHNIIAFKAEKREWLELVQSIDNPTIQIYYSGGFVWTNLRNAINAMEFLPKDLFEKLKEHFPTTWTVVETGGDIDDTELINTPYSTDRVFLQEKKETSSGWIGLVDKLELGTEMDYYTFIVECPLFVARQWHRHRFGSYNEVSRRYTAYDIRFYIPEVLRKQAKSNKQASIDEPVEEPFQSEFLKEIKRLIDESYTLYEKMTEKEVAKELARGILPQFMKTRYYWTVPRVSLDNFITLRTHEGAQKEIREFAQAIKELVGYKGTDRKNRL